MRKSPTGFELSFCQGRIIGWCGPKVSKPSLFRGPALFHQLQQMSYGLFVAAIFLLHQLPRPFVQLRSHLQCFPFGATHLFEDRSKLFRRHEGWTGAEATMRTLSTFTRVVGLLASPPRAITGVSPIFPSTSSPRETLPN